MYFELIRDVLVTAVKQHARRSGRTEDDILRQIREHIDATQREHYSAGDPDIDYVDPLCRLGYVYRHASANAFLFEYVLRNFAPVTRSARQRRRR
jgi:hypothetical protein